MSNPPLVTVHLFVSKELSTDDAEYDSMVKRLQEREITLRALKGDSKVEYDDFKSPRVYFSVGPSWSEFNLLANLPLHERKRWLHFEKFDDVQPFNVFNTWLSATDPLPSVKVVPPTQFSSSTPLVSLFTSTYRSGKKIQRPYRSLLAQSYKNWEWVIVDDSGDEDKTYNECIAPLKDPRIKKFRQEARSGYIGTVKRAAAGLCTGEILIEVDHDDDLTPDCIERIVAAFRRHPECGFAYADAAEVYEENNHAHWYGWDAGFGWLVYWRQHMDWMGRWQNAQRTADMNWKTIRHLVGLPNHPRAWTRDCYWLVGGHRTGLSVADDYDLLVRTMLCTKFVRVPHLIYIQYRNEGGNNFTFKRLGQIQILCAELEKYYKVRIDERMKRLGLPSLESAEYKRIWTVSGDDDRWKTSTVTDLDEKKTSIIIPILKGEANKCTGIVKRTIQECVTGGWKDTELIVVGQVPSEVEEAALKAPNGSIRWWPLEVATSVEDCLRWGGLIRSGARVKVLLCEDREQKRGEILKVSGLSEEK